MEIPKNNTEIVVIIIEDKINTHNLKIPFGITITIKQGTIIDKTVTTTDLNKTSLIKNRIDKLIIFRNIPTRIAKQLIDIK